MTARDTAGFAARFAGGATFDRFVWSVKRELWEHRAVTAAPMAVTLLVLLASLSSLAGLPRRMEALSRAASADQHAAIVKPFILAPAPVMMSAILVALFYCIDALYGERRDRSILFWKSLPVSDAMTVLSKAAIPLVVLPLMAFALSLSAFYALLIAGTVIAAAAGVSPALLWSEVRSVQQPIVMLYGLVVHALWHAPVYCWLLLVSVWAKRAPFLWAALPPTVIVALEMLVSGSSAFLAFSRYRVAGAMGVAFSAQSPGGRGQPLDMVSQLTPGRFLNTPGLWTGLAFAAVCLAAAIQLRRRREPA